MDQIRDFFVYGTLKRGQVRERAWPHPPRQIRTATTPGWLFDLGNYPAMLAGDDLVLGELWEFAARHVERTMSVLDEIEDYFDQPDDLYQRVVLECTTSAGATILAYGYRYADESLPLSTRVPAKNGICSWPSSPA